MNTFILIVLGQIVSLFGNAALRFALPLYLLRQTGSAALYGGITALAMLPALAGMLTGGALADRCRKARLMALLDLVTAGIAAAAAAGLPHLSLLPLILTVLGSLYAIQGLYQPVVRACLPLLLNGTQLLRGNAVIQLVDTVDELLGPLLGAVLLERLGIRGLLALSGVCAALGLALRVPTLQFGSILVLGAVFMAVAALFNVWFFAQLQVLVPQAQLGKTTACLSVLACLTQPIGQAAYGSAFQHWAAHPADVLLAAGVLSALVLWLLQTRRTV